jgi:hypothetical protein
MSTEEQMRAALILAEAFIGSLSVLHPVEIANFAPARELVLERIRAALEETALEDDRYGQEP